MCLQKGVREFSYLASKKLYQCLKIFCNPPQYQNFAKFFKYLLYDLKLFFQKSLTPFWKGTLDVIETDLKTLELCLDQAGESFL